MMAFGQLNLSMLQSFQELHPVMDPMNLTSHRLVDPEAEDVDAAIRVRRGIYPGLSRRAADRRSRPPGLLAAPLAVNPLRQPADLRRQVLLHDFSVSRDGDAAKLRTWLMRAGVTDVEAEKGPV